MGSVTGVQLPAGLCWDFFFSPLLQMSFGAHPASYSVGTRGSFPRGVKWPVHEADCSPSFIAKVKNVCSCTSTPPWHLHIWYTLLL